VFLGAAGSYAILAQAATSNVPTSAITGNVGLSPGAARFITGYELTHFVGGAVATSTQVNGNVYAADYAVAARANLTTAIGDMRAAYANAARRRTPDHAELAGGNIGGLTLPAGLYRWSNSVTIPTSVTLKGGANDVWIFQVAGGVTEGPAARVILTGGALAYNVFWQVAGTAVLGTSAHMEGEVLSLTGITLNTGATVNGRLLAQTAVTLSGNTIVGR
jgi:hypothetical protein